MIASNERHVSIFKIVEQSFAGRRVQMYEWEANIKEKGGAEIEHFLPHR